MSRKPTPSRQAESIAEAGTTKTSGYDLLFAAGLVAKVINTLDRTSTRCTCCGRLTYTKVDEFRRADELEALHRKLLRHADEIDGRLSGDAEPEDPDGND